MHIKDGRNREKDIALGTALALAISYIILKAQEQDDNLDDTVVLDALGRVMVSFVGDVCCEEHLNFRVDAISKTLAKKARAFFNKRCAERAADDAAQAKVAVKH